MKKKTKDILCFLKYKETSTDIAIAIGINLDDNGGKGRVTPEIFNFSAELVNNFSRKLVKKIKEKEIPITVKTIENNKNLIAESFLNYGATNEYFVADSVLIDFCHDKCMDLIEFRLKLGI
tara:strand:+ start:4455 stop:4817 length:363 start_codon:yes stop_codon:yes gene_type:complete